MSDEKDMTASLAKFQEKKAEAAELAGGNAKAIEVALAGLKTQHDTLDEIGASLQVLGTKAALDTMSPLLREIVDDLSSVLEKVALLQKQAETERDRLSK